MSAAKHTPGPWERLPEIDDETGEPTGRLDDVIYGPAYTQHFAGEDHHGVRDTVCVVGFSAHSSHEANAQAICAVPDMLAALRAVAAKLDSRPYGTGSYLPKALRDQVFAAIAKATGGAA